MNGLTLNSFYYYHSLMNEEAREQLNKIIQKEPYELTKIEIAFIRSRRSYLTQEEKNKFASFLKEEKKTK